jgi:hypothetical protein
VQQAVWAEENQVVQVAQLGEQVQMRVFQTTAAGLLRLMLAVQAVQGALTLSIGFRSNHG